MTAFQFVAGCWILSGVAVAAAIAFYIVRDLRRDCDARNRINVFERDLQLEACFALPDAPNPEWLIP